MCKNKIIIKNKRYQPTKKNGYTKETPRDRRLSYIEIPCGECKECKKKSAFANCFHDSGVFKKHSTFSSLIRFINN